MQQSGTSEKYNAKDKKKVVLLSPSANESDTWTPTPLPTMGANVMAKTSTANPLHNQTKEKLTPTRFDKRNAALNDQDSLERLTKLKARKNMDDPHSKGTIQGDILAMVVGEIAEK